MPVSPRLSLEVVLRISTKYFIVSWPKPYLLRSSLSVNWSTEINFLLSELFFHVFVPTVSPPFCFFLQTLPPD